MPFPFSFGSFGDIITAADLAVRIAKALSSSAGSSYEYQYLIQELNALAHILRLADAATRTGLLQRDIVDNMCAEIMRCQSVMTALWERIRGYQKSLGGHAWSGGGGTSWRKIGWALFKTQDVRETREKLNTHRLTLISYMTACNSSNLEDLRTQNTNFERNIHVRLNEIYNVIRQIPQKLGYSRANGIILQDWRGLETVLPPDLCGSKAQFIATLVSVSFNWPLFVRTCIEYSAFIITSDESKLLVLKTSTEDAFMSVLAPGNVIRVGTLITRDCGMGGDLSVIPEDTFGIQTDYCNECLQNGRRSLYYQYMVAMNDLQSVLHIGCTPGIASWKVTVEEYWDTWLCRIHQVYTLHDPCCRTCAVGDAGTPVVHLPLAQEKGELCVEIELYPDGSFLVQHGHTFPYSYPH